VYLISHIIYPQHSDDIFIAHRSSIPGCLRTHLPLSRIIKTLNEGDGKGLLLIDAELQAPRVVKLVEKSCIEVICEATSANEPIAAVAESMRGISEMGKLLDFIIRYGPETLPTFDRYDLSNLLQGSVKAS